MLIYASRFAFVVKYNQILHTLNTKLYGMPLANADTPIKGGLVVE